jgi:hypothetical protein
MLLPLLVVTLIALALVLRAQGGRRSPARLERFYLLAAPLPVVLVLVVPGVVGLTQGFDGHNRGWINRANWSGAVDRRRHFTTARGRADHDGG